VSGINGDRIMLIDAPDESGRSTATLIASLAARLATLYVVSGAAAVGSMISGFAAIGRNASKTAEGARLRRALECGRVAGNGEAIWTSLRIRQWASLAPPAPLLEQMRNDMALLLAPNLEETLSLLPIPGEPAGALGTSDESASEFLDCIIGMWAYSRDLVDAVEALAAPTSDGAAWLQSSPDPAPPRGAILR
jgi:hypothetical protein